MTERGLNRNQLVSELCRSPHGALAQYIPIGTQGGREDPEFLAHLIAWNAIKGSIRDAKIALPVVSLAAPNFPSEFVQNSLAHLALLGPRELLRAWHFVLDISAEHLQGRRNSIERLIRQWLQEKECGPRWDGMMMQHRKTLRSLYSIVHAKPIKNRTNVIIYGRNLDGSPATMPAGSAFALLSELPKMSPVDAAAAIVKHRIPFIIAKGVLGPKIKDPDLLHALMTQMTPSQFVTHQKMLKNAGAQKSPATRGLFEEKLAAAGKSRKNTLKTTAAIEALDEEEDEAIRDKLRALQTKQIASVDGIEGNWLVLADRSPSMRDSIETARHVAAALTKFVRGQVHLIFFDANPLYHDVSGKSYDEILAATKYVVVGGGTSIGVGVQYARERNFIIDGIAVVSDAAENWAPSFVDQYQALCRELAKDIPVYLYRFPVSLGMQALRDVDLAHSMQRAGQTLHEFDLTHGKVDYYAIPNMVQTMRTKRFGMADEILASRLLTLDDVFKLERKEVVTQ